MVEFSEAVSGNAKNRRLRDDVADHWAEALLLAGPVFLALGYFKYWELRYRGAGAVITRLATERSDWISPAVSPFLGDATESLLFLPLIIALVGLPFQRRARLVAGYLTCELVLLLATIAWVATVAVGRLPNRDLLNDFIRAAERDLALVDPRSAVEPRVWLKASLFVASGVCGPLLVLAWWRAKNRFRGVARTLLLLPLLPLLLDATRRIERTQLTAWDRGWFSRMVSSLASSDVVAGDTAMVDRATTLRAYAERFDTGGDEWTDNHREGPVLVPRPPPNIVMVVLETAPARDYPLEDSIHFPRLHPLLGRSLIAEQHFAASPSSSRSDFTILTSLYDGPGLTSPPHVLFESQPSRRLDALPRILADHGYATRYYYPADYTFPEDGWLLKWVDFQVIAPRPTRGTYRMQSAADRLEAERDLFRRVIADLPVRFEPRPFFALVRTLIGHYPIIDPAQPGNSGSDQRSLAERKLALAQFQDSLMGELVSQLANRQLLEHTILLVTGDHGVRTLGEDPQLDLGVLNEATFHVPLVIYDPASFMNTLRVGVPTSHIDITPTLLALAGIGGGPYLHLGRPMWDPALADRPVCFFTEFQGGMMGCVQRRVHYMESPEGGLAFLADTFRFLPTDLVPPGSSVAEAGLLHADLDFLRRLRSAWVEALLTPADTPAGR